LARGNAFDFHAARAFVAVYDNQQVPFGSGRKRARFRQCESATVAFREPNPAIANNKVPFHLSRVAVPVLDSHKTPDKLDRARRYLSLIDERMKLQDFLGDGTDGAVWATSRDSAVKVFDHERGYFNERDTYQRLAKFDVTEKLGDFWIAKMIGCSDDLMVVEMDLMQNPPYIIDFAKVRLDRPPEFSESTLEDSEEQGRELFGNNWRAVKRLLADLESFQIYYLDPKPHNIVFPTTQS
jgi:hypothetical protein